MLLLARVCSSVTDMSYLDTASEQGQSEGTSTTSLAGAAAAAAAGGVSATVAPGSSGLGRSVFLQGSRVQYSSG